MRKIVNLKNDQIFRHAVSYHDGINYPMEMRRKVSRRLRAVTASVREKICDLVLYGKLDRTDLRIISTRDCSPMPSMRQVAAELKISASKVSRRLQRIGRLVTKG